MAASDHHPQQRQPPRKSKSKSRGITPEELHKEQSKPFEYLLKLCNNRGNSQGSGDVKPPIVVHYFPPGQNLSRL